MLTICRWKPWPLGKSPSSIYRDGTNHLGQSALLVSDWWADGLKTLIRVIIRASMKATRNRISFSWNLYLKGCEVLSVIAMVLSYISTEYSQHIEDCSVRSREKQQFNNVWTYVQPLLKTLFPQVFPVMWLNTFFLLIITKIIQSSKICSIRSMWQ
jgi:hypothetical protein